VLKRLRAIVGAPFFPSARENAAASLLNAVLWLTIAGAVVFEGFQLSAGIDAPRVAAIGGLLALAVVALGLLRRRQLRASAWLVTATLFGIACFSMWFGGGISAPGAATLLVLIVMSAMALEWPPTVVWTALSIAALSGFVLAELQGWLPTVVERRPPPELGFIYLIHLLATVFLVSYSAGAFRGVLGSLGQRSMALADSEERYARLVEQLPDVVVALDADGIVVECSPAIEALYGYRPDEIIGRAFRDLGVIPENWLDQNLDRFRALLDADRSQLEQTQVIHRDGSVRWAEANYRVVRREDGSVRVYLVIRDIQERVEADERRAALEGQLVEARRLEALGRMAGGVAHDFNNLLLVILSNAELLLANSKDSDAVLLEEIRVAGGTAADLTAQLLAFAGRRVQDAESVDVAETLARIDSLLRRLLHANVELEIATQGPLAPARCDPAQLEQVIVNLVLNAQQAMPEGGKISLETAAVEVSEADCERFSGASPGPHVRLSVSDTGCGMSDHTVGHIFEPFYSERPGGTGLGLATVHGTVSQNGGHVRVRSRVGEGTRFEILLPHAAPPSSRSHGAAGFASEATGAVVLVVDDQAGVLNSVAGLLESRGFRVLRANSPEAARAVSAREPGRIDILLSDVQMQDTTGPRLAADLAGARPEMRVLLMSGYTEDQLEPRELASTNVEFISKPFSGDELAARIQSILSEGRSTPTRSHPPGANSIGSEV
jgi:PAS domain S-box-containing protein